MKSTEFIFISETAIIGGIETLMARMANIVNSKGFPVTVYSPKGPIVTELAEGVRWINTGADESLNRSLAAFVPLDGTQHVSIWQSHPYMIPQAYSLQKQLWRKLNISSNSLSGVFIPAQHYNADKLGKIKELVRKIKTFALMNIPPRSSIYFMSEAVRESFVLIRGRRYIDWPVKKLAFENSRSKAIWEPKQTRSLSVVSIGRLTHFKTYNFGASDIVKELRSASVDCHWKIWGDGEDLVSAKEYAESSGVQDYLQFCGTLPYNRLAAEVCKHDIFVGMGTAALEAAACAVPTLIAIAGSKYDCAGYLFEAPSDSIGEEAIGVERKSIASLLRKYHCMSNSERMEIGYRCRAAVKDRMQTDESELIKDLMDGLCYPTSLRNRIRMGFYASSMEIWRALAKMVRRSGNPNRGTERIG